MLCPLWHPTRLSGFILSGLVFARKDKIHYLFSNEFFPVLQALPATSPEPAAWSSSVPQESQDTHQGTLQCSNKGTCKQQLVLPLTIWTATVWFESKASFVLPKKPMSNCKEERVYSRS